MGNRILIMIEDNVFQQSPNAAVLIRSGVLNVRPRGKVIAFGVAMTEMTDQGPNINAIQEGSDKVIATIKNNPLDYADKLCFEWHQGQFVEVALESQTWYQW